MRQCKGQHQIGGPNASSMRTEQRENVFLFAARQGRDRPADLGVEVGFKQAPPGGQCSASARDVAAAAPTRSGA